MTFDGFFIYHLIPEMKSKLLNSRLDKINLTNEDQFYFSFYHKGNKNYLRFDLNSSKGICFLDTELQSSTSSSLFLVLLKKHLLGSILTDIEQYQTDRVIIFTFKSHDIIEGYQEIKLIFEAMGRHANLFLVKDSIIINVYKKMFNKEGRQLLPKANFEYFKTDKKPFLYINYQEVYDSKTLVNNYLGISPLLANYLFNNKCDITKIKINPTKDLTTNRFYCFDLFDGNNKKYYSSLSELLSIKENKEQNDNPKIRNFINKHLKKLNEKKLQIEKQIADAKKALTNKENGDLIYQSNVDLTLKLSNLDNLSLNPNKTLNENAQDFYKIYTKAKKGLTYLEKQETEIKNQIDLFCQHQTFLEISESDDIKDLIEDLSNYGFKTKQKQITRKKNTKPHIKQIKLNDDLIFIGKNHLQNAYLIKEIALKTDYWFHVKDAPGSHVILRTKNLNEENIRACAMLASYYSSMKESSSIPVNYTLVKNLKKIKGMASHQLSYSNEKTIFIDIDKEKISNYLI